MFSIIKYTAKLVFYTASYVTILSYLGDLATDITGSFAATPLVTIILNILIATVSTLSWIFSRELINFAFTIWILLPISKVGFYITKKFL